MANFKSRTTGESSVNIKPTYPTAIIISNQCILPEGWTADTLMGPHDSIPYNPGIAGVFYRAGYIETWGRGIRKICDACSELDTEPPRYEIIGDGIRIHFAALQSALIKDFNPPKYQPGGLNNGLNGGLNGGLNEKSEDTLVEIILQESRDNPKITQTELSKKPGISYRSVEGALLSGDAFKRRPDHSVNVTLRLH